MKAHWTIFYKETAQMLHSQRGLLWLLAFSGLLSSFSLLLVSNTDHLCLGVAERMGCHVCGSDALTVGLELREPKKSGYSGHIYFQAQK